MMLNIKHKFATLALLLVLAAPFANTQGLLIDFGSGNSGVRGCAATGGC